MSIKIVEDNLEKIHDIFNEYKLYSGRMISHSKSFYWEQHPYNTVIFNANIIAKNEEGNFIKIWWGDIDLSEEGDSVKEIAKELDTTLYVLYEMDGRFENEENPKLNDNTWNTTKMTPYVTEEETELRNNLKEIDHKQYLAQKKLDEFLLEKENDELPLTKKIKKIGQKEVIDTIQINFEELETYVFKKSKKISKLEWVNNSDIKNFANDYILSIINPKDDMNFCYGNYLISYSYAEKLRNLFMNSINQQYSYEKTVTKDEVSIHSTVLVVVETKTCNEEGIHRDSLKEDTIYIIK